MLLCIFILLLPPVKRNKKDKNWNDKTIPHFDDHKWICFVGHILETSCNGVNSIEIILDLEWYLQTLRFLSRELCDKKIKLLTLEYHMIWKLNNFVPAMCYFRLLWFFCGLIEFRICVPKKYWMIKIFVPIIFLIVTS